MKRKSLKIFALILAVTAIFALSACDKKEKETTTEEIDETESISDEVSSDEIEQSSDNETKISGEESVEDSSKEAETEETQPQDKAPQTKEEIVKYYADAVNKVKSSAKSVNKVYTNTINYEKILEIGNNKVIEGIAQSLMGTFLKEDHKKVTYTSTADYEQFFPPTKSATSNLNASMVDVAEIKDNGSEYEIKIVLNSSMSAPDVDPPMGGGKAGTAFNIVDIKDVTDAAGNMVKLEGLKNSYFDASLLCKIDKATGNMTYLEQKLPSTMEFSKAGVAIVNVSNVKIGLEYQHKWEIEW